MRIQKTSRQPASSGLLPGLKSGDVRNAVLFLNVFVRSAPFPRNTAPHRALRDRLAALLES